MTFLDASVLLASIDVDDRNHESSLRLLHVGGVWTLDLAVYEVTNTTDGKWAGHGVGPDLRSLIWEIERERRLVRVDEQLIDAAAEIQRSHGITSYDAAYVAGARSVGRQLVSCDERDLVSKGLAKLPADALTDLR